ncbi:MAG TPA: aromatic amino acid lyase, partial [Gemmatimonadales bacterium]|nr:aromatic amino acid lyase [Gemmatimonadales bacterium]
ALANANIQPITLRAKEGLALVNGTAFMTGIAALNAADARRLAHLSDVTTALTVEVLMGITGPFDEFVHEVAKPHPGQIRSAANVRQLLENSSLAATYDQVTRQAGPLDKSYRELGVQIQDKYSLRCAPHFTGVLYDTLDWVDRWLTIEINSSNDNPLFDTASGRVISGGKLCRRTHCPGHGRAENCRR